MGGKELRSSKEGYLLLMVLEVSKRSFLLNISIDTSC